jgi:signal transduction histidine kinase
MTETKIIYLLASTILALFVVVAVLLIYYRRSASSVKNLSSLINEISEAGAVISDGKIIAVNQALEKLLQRNRAELIGHDIESMVQSLDLQESTRAHFREQLAHPGNLKFTLAFLNKDKKFGVLELNFAQIGHGTSDFFLLVYNISEREVLEQQQKNQEAQFDWVKQISGLGFWLYDVKSGQQEWSDYLKAMFVIKTPEDELPFTDQLFDFRHLHPDDIYIRDTITDAVQRGENPPTLKFRVNTPSGKTLHVQLHMTLLKDETGATTHIFAIVQDLSEKVESEHRFLQAQKMVAAGNLTGGLAHDFNNLLHVILGNVEIMSTPNSDSDIESLAAIARAAHRGAELTQRLLAFSRKQVLDLQAVNIEQSMKSMVPLLSRTLGAAIDIELHRSLGLRNCYIDSHQLESCILNLAINARHAMPDGGTLTIEAFNKTLDQDYADKHDEVIPGEYVQLNITDTGIGMAPEVVDRVFEPFFTTREVGEGSGLGLSMVFGFIKQSKGHVSIYSEESIGTSINLFLPVTTEETTKAIPESHKRDSKIVGKVLLVEDNLQVAESFARQHPSAKTIYMSGYTENAIAQHGILDEGTVLLNKPFTRTELVEKILHTLDSN